MRARLIRFPSLKVAGRSFTNATIKKLNLTQGVVIHDGGGAKIELGELPEPYRSQYYDEVKVQKLRDEAKAKADAEKAKREAERAGREAEKAREEQVRIAALERFLAESTEARKPFFTNSLIEISPLSVKQDGVAGRHISGVLKNLEPRWRTNLVIRLGIYDNGIKTGTASDSILTLGPNESWRFEVMTYRKGAKYKLEEVRCNEERLDGQ